jgi:hypothetical protein
MTIHSLFLFGGKQFQSVDGLLRLLVVLLGGLGIGSNSSRAVGKALQQHHQVQESGSRITKQNYKYHTTTKGQ